MKRRGSTKKAAPPRAAKDRPRETPRGEKAAKIEVIDRPREPDGGDEVAAGEAAGARVVDVYPEEEKEARRGASSSALTRLETKGEIVRLDPLTLYIGELRRYPLLDPEEEKRLSVLYYENKDEEAARRIVTSNLKLVVKIAFEYRRAYKNVLDLIQEGNIGLILALKKFDPYRGVRFISYAAWWIRAYILRYVLNNWRMVRIGTTQTQRKLFFNLHKEKTRLEQLGIKPEASLLADALHVEESEVAEMDRRLQATDMSLDSPLRKGGESETTKMDTLGDPSAGADELLELAQFNETLHDRLGLFGSTLAGKEKLIFDQRMLADRPLTLQEIGDRYGITRERIRQIETRVMKKLRKYLLEEMGDYFDETQWS